MPMKKLLLAMLFLSPFAPAQDLPGELGVQWNRRTAEHLLNRAGFGARPEAIDAAVAQGLEATIDGFFLDLEDQAVLFDPDRKSGRDGKRTKAGLALRAAGGKANADKELIEDARAGQRKMRRIDRKQLGDYSAWWLDSMIAGEDPLRDRMTLFWHGYFTSSMRDVKSSYQLIQQNQLLRTSSLGRFGELLFAIAKDPAMLEYLDNDKNRKGSPNENFAREVMELFTLGEGNYTEDDIKEAARAFTGWRSRKGEFIESKRGHDRGEKTVLGVTGNLGGDDVLAILLNDKHCAAYVAGRIIEYLEGAVPSDSRREIYAELLRTNNFAIEVFLRALFRDPDFYREEVLGNRVAGPIEYLVGMARRLDLTPPQVWLSYGSRLLGQELFFPPSVKGWDEGMAWITTASLMQRGNLAGILVGAVQVADVLEEEPVESMADLDVKAEKNKPTGLLKRLKKIERSWKPALDLVGDLARSGANSEGEIVDILCDRLLAIELPVETRAFLIEQFSQLKTGEVEAGRRPRARARRKAEFRLRRLAHLILSLPEAQLN